MGLFSAIGGLFGGKGRKKAAAAYAEAAKFKPYNLSTPFGGVSFANGQAATTLSPEYQQLRQSLFGALGNINLGQQGGLPGIGQGFNINPVAGLNMTGAPTSAGMGNPMAMLGNNQQALGGLAAALGLADSTAPGAANMPTTPFGNMFGAAQDALGRANGLQERQFQLPNTTATFSNRLDLLRQLSKADENQFFQSNLESQYGKGILASSAGQYQTGAALDALNRADTQRQLTAMDFAGQDFNQALSQQALENQTVAGQRGFFGNLAGQLNSLGMQGAGLESQNQQYLTESANNRVMERFARAMNMFGANQSSTQQDNAAMMQAYGLDLNRLGLDQNAYGMDLNAQTANANIGLQNNSQLMQALAAGQGLQLDNARMGQGQQAINAGLFNNFLSAIGGIDSMPMQMIQLGGNLGSQQSSANAAAYAPMYDAAVKQAQAWAALGSGIDSTFSGFGMGGGGGGSMFGGGSFMSALGQLGGQSVPNPFGGMGTVGFNPYAANPMAGLGTVGFDPNNPLMMK